MESDIGKVPLAYPLDHTEHKAQHVWRLHSLAISVNKNKNYEKALWQKFQAKKGHEELEKEIEKEFGKM